VKLCLFTELGGQNARISRLAVLPLEVQVDYWSLYFRWNII